MILCAMAGTPKNKLTEIRRNYEKIISTTIGQNNSSKNGYKKITTYTNPTFNITYTSPIGWDFTPDQIFEGPLGAAVLFIGHPSYPDLQFLAVAGFKKSTELEADYFNFTQNYGAVNRAFTYSINLAPLIYFSADTMINNIHYVISKIKDVEKNEIEVMYTCSNSY
jgi:hypothetical protein